MYPSYSTVKKRVEREKEHGGLLTVWGPKEAT